MRSTLLLVVITLCAWQPAFAAKSNFNPDISLILDGRYVSYSNTSDYELPGFMLGPEAERSGQGLQLGHGELSLSANIDDMFYGKLTTAIADHEGETEIELEEAFIKTLALGNGFSIKAGRFFSDIGYLNNQHTHAWDFTDAPLIYRGLFGNQLIDDGLQISWLAPTDLFLKLGLESLRGERFPAGGATNNGSGAYTLFAKLGGDVGISHSWQLGLSHWTAQIENRNAAAHEEATATPEIPSFSGDSTINGIDFIWKWAPKGNKRERYLTFQAEYFERNENGNIELINSSPLETSTYDGKQSGWYLQTVYKFKPQWRIGYRYDQLKANNSGSDINTLTEAGVNDQGHKPTRSSLMLDYSHSEYSRIRLQLSKDDSYPDSDNIIMIQYIMALGTHGAHSF